MTNCGRVSSLALGGASRNQCTLAQPCPASQTRFGTRSAAAMAAASGKPHERRTSRRQTRNVAMSRTRTTAIVYFVSSPMPAATPSSGHEPRPSASRSASQRTTIVVSWSSATGWKSRLVASIPGENPITTAASVCARRDAPSSRATSAPTTTVPAAARIVIARKADERPAEQLAGQRREQRRHRRELDIAALQVQAGDGVVELVAVPAVASGDGELQRALQRDDGEHGAGRECDRRPLYGPERHGPTKTRDVSPGGRARPLSRPSARSRGDGGAALAPAAWPTRRRAPLSRGLRFHVCPLEPPPV